MTASGQFPEDSTHMRTSSRPVIAALAIAALAGCSDVPPLSDDIARTQRDAAYPALIPADRITGSVPPPSAEARDAAPTEARAARLRARAARLDAPVIDDATRDRMQTGVVR